MREFGNSGMSSHVRVRLWPVMINEITTITETDFQYHTAFELLPQAPYDEGLHTINFEDGLLIVDGKRKVLSAMGPFKKVIRKLKSLNNAN